MTGSRAKSASIAASPERGHGKGIALLVIASCQLMVVLDVTIVNIALPHIQSSLGFSTESLSWVINAYTLTFGGLLLLGGRLGDILGRRRVFIFGVLLFVVASLLGGLSQESWQLLAARALQGVGGAIASPTALSLITTTFREGPEAQPGVRGVRGGVGGRQRDRPARRRSARRVARLALGALRQHTHRPADRPRHASPHQGVRAASRPLRPPRRAHLHPRHGAARLRLHPGLRGRLERPR